MQRQSNRNSQSSINSQSKYKKFTGIGKTESKKQVSIGGLSKDSNCSRSISQNSLKPTFKSMKSSTNRIINPRKQVSNRAMPNKNDKIIKETLKILQDLVKDIARMVQQIKREVQRTVDNFARQMKKDLQFFHFRQQNAKKQIKLLEQLFKNSKVQQTDLDKKVIRTQSLTTSEEQHSQFNLPARPKGFNNPIRLRDQIKDAELKAYKKEELRHESRKQIEQNCMKKSFQSVRSSRNRSRSRSITQKFKGLQNQIGSIKSILVKQQKQK